MSTKKSPVRHNKPLGLWVEPALFDRFDAYCKANGFNKSGIVERLLRQLMDGNLFSFDELVEIFRQAKNLKVDPFEMIVMKARKKDEHGGVLPE